MLNDQSISDGLSLEKRALLALHQMQAQIEALEQERHAPIAIVGMSCRFPGGANSPEEFWRILSSGTDAITEVPADRWNIDAVYDPNPETPDKTTSRWGGFIDQVDGFDAAFFGISPREARKMDPQQRIFLEVAWEALERAGQRLGRLAGSRSGIFVGVSNNDYFHLQLDSAPISDAYLETGNRNSFAAGRLAYLLDFRGPALALDTVSSSSLVAVHLACQSLRTGDCDLALAGAVNLILSPLVSVMVSKWGILSPDGRCKSFDARANGLARGEGCGVVALKRLADALADGDPVLAVIRGSAVNQDGHSAGMTAPNGQAQQALIRQALWDAGVAPEQIGYVETHGSGTALGDPIEVASLAAVLGRRDAGRPCVLGAVKSNIGHLESAAGMAGLIKVVLAFRHGMIPANLHFQSLNPQIALDQTRFVLANEPYPWPSGDVSRYAGISSFGLSGTNAHLVLEEAPRAPAPVAAPAPDRAYVLPLSARSQAALSAIAHAYRDRLTDPDAPPAYDICATTALRRTPHPQRLAVLGDSARDLADALAAFLAGEPRAGVISGESEHDVERQLVFVFPGQGSQWAGMGRQLYAQEAAFRDAITRCDAAFRRYVDWSLIEQLASDSDRFADIDVIQPMLFAIQIGLAALWESWGVQPGAVVGHSMGEVAAAYVAGMLSLDDAARIICRRSLLLRRICGQGAMLLVERSVAQAQELIAPYGDRVAVAVNNSARSTVLAGDAAALECIHAALARQEVFCRWVKVDVASHSPQVEPLLDDLAAELAEVAPRVGQLPLYSTVAETICMGEELTARYWARNLRSTVMFGSSIQRLVADGYTMFLEVSAHPILLPAIAQGLHDRGAICSVLPSLQRDADESRSLLETLGKLYVCGYPVRWEGCFPERAEVVDLPTYPWQRERFWIDGAAAVADVSRRGWYTNGADIHPLLGTRVRLASAPHIWAWENLLDLKRLAHLADHQVQGMVILPAAAYLELAQAAAREVFGTGNYQLDELQMSQPMVLHHDAPTRTQVIITQEDPGAALLQVFSHASVDGTGDMAGDGAWCLHASARVGQATAVDTPARALAVIRARCPEAVSGATHYTALAGHGLHYGPRFRYLRQIWRGPHEVLAQVEPEEYAPATGAPHWLHLALLDACLQTLGCLLPETGAGDPRPYLPVGVEQVRLPRHAIAGPLWVHARQCEEHAALVDLPRGDIEVLDADGVVLWTAYGVCLQRVELDQASAPADAPAPQTAGAAARDDLWAAAPAFRRRMLEAHLRDQIVQVLHLAPEKIGARTPLGSLGFDSLTALELRNRLEVSLGLALPGTLIWGYPTITALAPYLAGQMALPLAAEAGEAPAPLQPPAEDDLVLDLELFDTIALFSDDDVRQMLSGSK